MKKSSEYYGYNGVIHEKVAPIFSSILFAC